MIIATFCGCGSVHDYCCPIPVIHEIKERVCQARGIVSYIPDDVQAEIDALVAREMKRRRERVDDRL